MPWTKVAKPVADAGFTKIAKPVDLSGGQWDFATFDNGTWDGPASQQWIKITKPTTGAGWNKVSKPTD